MFSKKRRSAFDWIGGLVIALVGIYVSILAIGYELGDLRRMGPGFFPLAAGCLLVLFGTSITIWVREVEPQFDDMRWQAALSVFAAILAWGLLLEPFGLIPATAALVLIAALAHPKPHLYRIIGTVVLLPLIGWLVFIKGLGIQVPAFSFMGG